MMYYLTVDSVKLNGQIRPYTHSNNLLTILSGTPLQQGTSFETTVYYHGTPSGSGFFSGISSAYNSAYGKRVTWTLSEPFNARQWWPCKQDLTDKADSSWAFFTCVSSEMVGSNGLLTNVVNAGGGKTRYEWKSKYPIAYYLISFSVSDYQDYSIYAYPQGLNDSILIQNFIYDHPNCLPNYQTGIDATADMIESFSELMGMYPFHEEKYGHCLAQIGGGMEHQTMSTMGSFSFELVSHELTHMWFGDNVTCATWSDIWINEGFASYGEFLAYEHLDNITNARQWMSAVNNNVMTQPGGSTYIPPIEIYPGNEWRIFNGRLSYNKGASIIHMIRHELQDDSVFFTTLQTFQDQFGDSVATGDDFKSVLNAVSGRDFTWFFDQWYYGEGYPMHDVSWYQMGDSLYLTVSQAASYPSVTPLFQMLIDYEIVTSQGTQVVSLFQDAQTSTFTVPVDGTVNDVNIDPYEWTLDMPGSIVVRTEDPRQRFSFGIFPNPSSGLCTLDLQGMDVQDFQWTLHDISGREVLRGAIGSGSHALDLGILEAGTYLLRVSDGSNVASQKIIRL